MKLFKFMAKKWSFEILNSISENTGYSKVLHLVQKNYKIELNHSLLSNRIKGLSNHKLITKSEKGYSITQKGLNTIIRIIDFD